MTVSIKNPTTGVGVISVDGADVITFKADGSTEVADIISPNIPKRVNITESSTLEVNNEYSVLSTATTVLTLPSSASDGDYVKVVSLTSSTVTVVPATGETVEGEADGLLMDLQFQKIELVYLGGNWAIVS